MTDPTRAPRAEAAEVEGPASPRGLRARLRRFVEHDKVKAAYARLRGGELTPARAAASVFVGVLVGTTPLYGLHFLLVMGICVPLRLDTAVAYVASNVSLPIFAPFINIAEIELGAWLRTGALIHLDRRDFDTRSPFDLPRARPACCCQRAAATLAASLAHATAAAAAPGRAAEQPSEADDEREVAAGQELHRD